MTDDEKAVEISKILAMWGPVDKERAVAIGLSDYDVEAQDILWAVELHGYSVQKAVSEVLQEAFLIELDKGRLRRYGSEIEAVLAKM
jgi:hypothetical protein